MRTLCGAVLATLALLVATAGVEPARATVTANGAAAPARCKPASNRDYVVQCIANAPPETIGRLVHMVYGRTRFVVDRAKNALILSGPARDVAGAMKLARLLDAMPDLTTRNKNSYARSVRVFPIDDPSLGPAVANALTAFLAAVPPGASASPLPGAATVNVNVGPAGASVQPPSSEATVVLSPSQGQIIVRADPTMLDVIQYAVLPALTSGGPPKPPDSPSQQYRAYEVRYPVPNPVPSGVTLSATSTIGDLAATVQTVMNQTGSADVKVVADPSYPRILVSGSTRGVQSALKVLRELDKRPALVGIEARFYEVDANVASNVGFQLPSGSIQTTIGEYSPPTTSAAGAVVSPTPAPLLSLQKFTRSNLSIAAQLNLLAQTGDAKLIASPNISTVNGRLTLLSVQNTIPFAVTNPGNSAAVPAVFNYQTGTKLEIVPMVNDDGSISAYLHPQYSTLTGFTSQNAPLTSTREAFTTFRLLSGQAVYISGLEEVSDSVNRQKVAGLGDIPLVGRLFRNKTVSRSTTQLYIILRAYVIDPGDLTLPIGIDPNNAPTPKPLPVLVPSRPVPAIPVYVTPQPTASPSPTPRPAGAGRRF